MRLISIIKDGLVHLKNIYVLFDNNSHVFFLFLIIMLVLLIVCKNKSIKSDFILPSFILLIIGFNPISISIMTRFLPDLRLVRLFWLFPITIIFAFFFTMIWEKFGQKKGFYLSLIAICLVIYFGKFMFSEENFIKSENIYKVPNEIVEICDFIESDGNEGVVLPSVQYLEYYRQYDANIKLVFGRDVDPSGDYYTLMASERYDLEQMKQLVSEYRGLKYIVLEKQKINENNEISEYYNVIFETQSFLICKLE